MKVKAAIDQFVEGLQCLCIDWYIKKYPKLMEPVFVYRDRKHLTAGMHANSYNAPYKPHLTPVCLSVFFLCTCMIIKNYIYVYNIIYTYVYIIILI